MLDNNQQNGKNPNKNPTLEHFMVKKVIILNGDLPITVACKYFYNYKVGSLLIETTEKEYACLTKTDIINIIGKGLDPGLVRTGDIASKPLITCPEKETLENAMILMAKNGIKRIFITNNKKKIIGVISSSDILRIAPGLLEIAREEMLIHSSEEIEEKKKFSGTCDDCREYSDFLTDVGGFVLCENCLKSHQDEEEDLESLNEDDDSDE